MTNRAESRPARTRRGKVLAWGKNAVIILLVASAVYLTTRVGIFDGGLGGDTLLNGITQMFFRKEQTDTTAGDSTDAAAAVCPVAVAVNTTDGRYGARYDADERNNFFTRFRELLQGALSTATSETEITEEAWRAALERQGVYTQLLEAVPLDALLSWLEAEDGGGAIPQGETRRLALARDETQDTVCLYYCNDTDGIYYACETGLSYSGHMENLLAAYTPNGASFVYEFGADAEYSALGAYVLLTPETVTPHIYNSSTPLSVEDEAQIRQLQRAVQFQPQVSSEYTVQNGIVVRDGADALRFGADGTVTFTSGEEEARYPLEGGGYADLVEHTYALAQATVGTMSGAAELYLIGVEEHAPGQYEVRYGYVIGGAPVYFTDGGDAARFSIQDGKIMSFTLRFRTYEDTGETTVVMREEQAAAAMRALGQEGKELVLSHEDSGTGTTNAGWVARSYADRI
ncbi:MAG: hypothetical protein LUG13_02465 [Oscillospiraceae bacterium]|nr:hypothetical protein [Oscillospiraceae bacterium]